MSDLPATLPLSRRAPFNSSARYDSVIDDGRPDSLLAAQVSFGGLDRDVTGEKLHLFELAAGGNDTAVRMFSSGHAGPVCRSRQEGFRAVFRESRYAVVSFSAEMGDSIPDLQ